MPFVSVTRLHLVSVRFFPVFLVRTFAVNRQARRSNGFITGWLTHASDWAFWTSTVWTSAEAMRAFRNSDVHLRVMPKLLRWCDEASFVHWEQEGDAPPAPEIAYERLQRDGRLSKVNAPSARQRARDTAGPVPPRRGQQLRPG
jgi:hypothetical protein